MWLYHVVVILFSLTQSKKLWYSMTGKAEFQRVWNELTRAVSSKRIFVLTLFYSCCLFTQLLMHIGYRQSFSYKIKRWHIGELWRRCVQSCCSCCYRPLWRLLRSRTNVTGISLQLQSKHFCKRSTERKMPRFHLLVTDRKFLPKFWILRWGSVTLTSNVLSPLYTCQTVEVIFWFSFESWSSYKSTYKSSNILITG